MTTWFDLWWLLAMPVFFLGLLTGLPTLNVLGHDLFGFALRAWLVNHSLLQFMPDVLADRLVHWFLQADTLRQWALSFFVAINLNAFMLPILFIAGEGMIRWSAWSTRKTIELRRRGAKR